MTLGGVETRYRRVVTLVLVLGVAAVAGAGSIVANAPVAAAACVTEDTPLTSITGRVVGSSMNGWDYTLAMVGDDGTDYTVKMFGRRPPSDGTAVENTVEEAYAGIRPEVGGRYLITGSLDDDGALRVDACVVGAKVDLLEDVPASTVVPAGALETAAEKTESGGHANGGVILLVVVVALVVVAIAALGTVAGVHRRRSQLGTPPSSS